MNTKLSSDVLDFVTIAAESAHFDDLFGGQLSHAVLLASQNAGFENTGCVQGVLGRCNPFQIMRAVLSPITVLMIHFHAFWAWTKEGFGNKAMDRAIDANSHAIAERDASVAISYGAWLQNIVRPVILRGCDMPHVSRITHFIESFKILDRKPRLIHYDGILA